MSERNEVVERVSYAAAVLAAAAEQLREIAADAADECEASADAAAVLVDALREIGEQYDVAWLAEAAAS